MMDLKTSLESLQVEIKTERKFLKNSSDTLFLSDSSMN